MKICNGHFFGIKNKERIKTVVVSDTLVLNIVAPNLVIME